MNAMLTTELDRATVHARVDEALEYIRQVRRQIDNLWHAARDATRKDPCFTPESNREGADNAAFEALQCLYHAEEELGLAKEARP